MLRENIFNNYVRKLYYVVTTIFDTHPLWWEVFIENIINNQKITYINYTTMIISIYELDVTKITILFEILKLMKKKELILKVINKKEFLIIHLSDEVLLDYLTSKTKWINLVVYKILSEEYPSHKIYLKDELIFVDNKVIHYFITDPSKKYQIDNKHQYIYLYKDAYKNNIGILDKQLKFYADRGLFIKKFQECLLK